MNHVDDEIKQISLVIPVFNEEENIGILSREIDQALNPENIEWECIWVDDGSTDGSLEQLRRLVSPHRVISLTKNCGQSTALMAGIDYATYSSIVTLDADLQNDPQDIPKLIQSFKDVDVVCGYRSQRKDNKIMRVVPSKIANFIARKVTGIEVRDLGCTLRIFRKELVSENRIHGEMHRVLVLYFANSGAKISEIPTNHRPRLYGESKYGIERTLKFIADLTLAKLTKVLMTRPLYFFGLLASVVFTFSTMIFVTSFIFHPAGAKYLVDIYLIAGALILFSSTIILVSVGLLFEVILRNAIRNDISLQYRVREI